MKLVRFKVKFFDGTEVETLVKQYSAEEYSQVELWALVPSTNGQQKIATPGELRYLRNRDAKGPGYAKHIEKLTIPPYCEVL